MNAGASTLAQPTPHFVALTVTDLDTSVAWYERLFGPRRTMGGEHETHHQGPHGRSGHDPAPAVLTTRTEAHRALPATWRGRDR